MGLCKKLNGGGNGLDREWGKKGLGRGVKGSDVDGVKGSSPGPLLECESPKSSHNSLSLSLACSIASSGLAIDAGVQVGGPAAEQRGEEVARSGWPRQGLGQAHHAGRAPHLDGGVVAGREKQLLVSRAEGHRVHHVCVLKLGQADVVVAVPDVAAFVLRTTGDRSREMKRSLIRSRLRTP